MIAGANCNAELAAAGMMPRGLPGLALIHDDFNPSSPLYGLTPFTAAGVDVVHNRLMSPRSQFYRQLPRAAHMVCGNEADSDWYAWELDYLLDEVRPNRPDLRLHHPAPNTAGEYPYDPSIAAACDVIDQHAGIGLNDITGQLVFFPSPTPVLFGKPVWITEVEVDPAHPELLKAIPHAMAFYAAAGYQAVFAWGVDQGEPDVLFHPELLADIAQLNTGPIPAPRAPRIPILAKGAHHA